MGSGTDGQVCRYALRPCRRYRLAWSADSFFVPLSGHADEVYCLDFMANKVVSGGQVRTVIMCVFSFFCSSCVELMSFRV